MYLLPRPQEMLLQDNVFYVDYTAEICIDPEASPEWLHYASLLQKEIEQDTGFHLNINRNLPVFQTPSILLKSTSGHSQQEYTLRIRESGILLTASSNSGMLYAIQTLRQIIRQEGACLPGLDIHDFPVISNRGLYYDVTRGRIPTLSYLKKMADTLSFYKINQLHLYIEHTYMFRNLSEVWRDDTPLTSSDILELDRYCADLGIELVPSIASFGHLYKILRTKSFRHLCEREDLCEEPFGFIDRMEHHTIDVSNEEIFSFIWSLIEEYLPLFRSDKFNICGDETFDLGTGKSHELAEREGTQQLYIQYIKKLCDALVTHGKTPMFWGDIVCKSPEVLSVLPKETICLNWGYDANVGETNTALLSKTGVRLYNCPGVSGWNQFVNQYHTAYENIRRMCSYGIQYGAEGILNTDWGDFGHINHPDMSVIGWIYGAVFSWNNEEIPFDEINHAISRIEFHDPNEQFVHLVHNISTLWTFHWGDLIGSLEKHRPFFDADHLPALRHSVKLLNAKRTELLSYISCMDGRKKDVIRPYLIALDGMLLLQEIAIFFVDRNESTGQENGRLLAGRLEHWFYYYKQEWRITSRESELYRTQNVINELADRLRG